MTLCGTSTMWLSYVAPGSSNQWSCVCAPVQGGCVRPNTGPKPRTHEHTHTRHTHTHKNHNTKYNPYQIVSRCHAGHSQYAYCSALLWVSLSLILV